MDNQSVMTYKVLCAMFDDLGWHYEKDDENLCISCGVQGDDLPMDIFIKLNTDLKIVSLVSFMPYTVPENKRTVMAIAVALANHGMVDGSFDYSVTEGKILFRLTAGYDNSLLSKETFKYMLAVSCNTIDAFNDKFLVVGKTDMDYKQLREYMRG